MQRIILTISRASGSCLCPTCLLIATRLRDSQTSVNEL